MEWTLLKESIRIPIDIFFYIRHLKIQRRDGWKARFIYRIPFVSSIRQACSYWILVSKSITIWSWRHKTTYTILPGQFKGNNKGKFANTRIFTYLHTLGLNPRNKLPHNMEFYSVVKCMILSLGSYVVLRVYKKV